MNLDRVRGNVRRMMRKFPSRRATLYRPAVDGYGQPTDVLETVGTVEACWTEGIERPKKWDIADAGERFEDEGYRWIAMVWRPDLPQARHGDVVKFADGEEGVVKNIANNANLRVFWQIGERGASE